ncbi:TonB-dependent receptor [Paraglaciecola aquimarina]|uniref:TonB-dependent receptor n=1 Tax=Paraglaciecola algarum TaxID=3050085 RepID=A0ABS9D817_9ALTE|nr:TonB-dependent receptor [Paraglaciecola sp. G1-23]MCF2949096.1 TonB-dependent receptor [Paraglaciecola sp. G1-23]
MHSTHPFTTNRNMKKSFTALAVLAAFNTLSTSVLAQATEQNTDDSAEIIEVRGIADAYRNAIAEKRSSATIVDALSSSDIGALPDLSVAETLERITGVSGDRFKGNASEISIRGLGPFLGFSTVNGRAISSGSGNRSVAFSQFPSELVNGVTVFKAQKADLLEGGVSGLIDLKTIKPVDYGKERFQTEMRLNYNPYQAKFNDDNGLGYRPSASYTNSFELDDGGKFGFAVGYAGARISSPEESYNTSSTLRNCNSDYAVDGGSNCSFSDARAAANGGEAKDGDYYFISNQFYYRQMESEEERDGVIYALQWQPNSDLDINLDGQWSNRYYYEDRHDLMFDDGRRRIANWTTNSEHALTSYTGESRISSYGEYRVREEEYSGVGLNIDWQASNDLHVAFDAAYSGTERYQTRTWARFRGDRSFYDWQNSDGQDFPSITAVYSDFDDPAGSAENWQQNIQDLAYFDADSEARNYRFDIEDTIKSYRLDFEYALDGDIFYAVRFGSAMSFHDHDNFGEERKSLSTPSSQRPEKIAAAVANCAIDFPQSDFGEDANFPVSSWGTFDTHCGYDVLVGDTDMSVDPMSPSENDVRMSEDITSFYAMADFSTEWGDISVDGNVGLRHVTTDISSLGIRTSYTVNTNDSGFISFTENAGVNEFSELQNSYSNILPSINLSFGLTDELQLRFAAYGGLSRPDMWYYGSARDIRGASEEDEFTTVQQALDGNVTARGNPYLEALESNNYDLSLSYYLGADTMLSAALYYKTFNARFDSLSGFEDVVVDGTAYNVEVQGRPTIVDEDSKIQGLELTVMHQFSNLPAPFNGLGTSLNYNYADSDFETPENGGSITQDVRDMIAPSDIAGLSKNTFSGQVYWESDNFSARLSYKYRSEYLKPFGSSLAQTNRFVDDTSSFDVDFKYDINKNITARFQILNLTGEPYVEQRVAHGAYNRIEHSGPRFFLGLKYRM